MINRSVPYINKKITLPLFLFFFFLSPFSFFFILFLTASFFIFFPGTIPLPPLAIVFCTINTPGSETNHFYDVARLIPPQYVVSFSCPLHHRKRTFKKRINPYQKSSRRSFALRYINEVYENKKNLSILFWSKIIAFLSQSLFGLVKVCLY